jgi:hypothetical protein
MKSLVVAAALVLSLSGPAGASSECSYAVDSYNSAVDDIGYSLKRYSQCVQDSRGIDDCSSEFRRLKNAQDDFESAVSEYQLECER